MLVKEMECLGKALVFTELRSPLTLIVRNAVRFISASCVVTNIDSREFSMIAKNMEGSVHVIFVESVELDGNNSQNDEKEVRKTLRFRQESGEGSGEQMNSTDQVKQYNDVNAQSTDWEPGTSLVYSEDGHQLDVFEDIFTRLRPEGVPDEGPSEEPSTSGCQNQDPSEI
ncbi:hypothetical protein HAX54_026409 [Datura stramonium]|uniref:Uncharacterized protein n=1 Tax=Datura stramonium TaxID=4076 RepID=A0ABS8S7T0_DATST|nr:hypothetical protein [Datura stramonium]